jgi:hypothetical protein
VAFENLGMRDAPFQNTPYIRFTKAHTKYHNETLCIDILNKQKYIFPLKNAGQKHESGPVWELVPVEVGRM